MYKTGDPHPNPALNLTRFVEYDPELGEVWTSVCEDSEAPYRLANQSAQRRLESKNTPPRSVDTALPGRPKDQNQSHILTDEDSGKSRAE
jgi:hypothetical protein